MQEIHMIVTLRTNGNPHDLGETGNPHDDHIERVGGGHDPEAGQDTCPGAK